MGQKTTTKGLKFFSWEIKADKIKKDFFGRTKVLPYLKDNNYLISAYLKLDIVTTSFLLSC